MNLPVEFKWSLQAQQGSIMSSIASLSSSIYVPPSSKLQGAQSAQGNGSDPDGDGDGGQKVKRHGGQGHGQMQNVLMQALQSLGLGGATGTTESRTTGTSGSSADSDGDTDGSGTAATGNAKSDIRQFMHALFQAVKGESTASSASGTSSGAGNDPKTNFAAGLSALISQVSNGQAPADLQNAFSQVVNDLQGAGGATSTGTNSSATGTTSPQVSLQALLTQMQQNLGYGAASSTAALGNIVSQHA
jgi:hypothetical protein